MQLSSEQRPHISGQGHSYSRWRTVLGDRQQISQRGVMLSFFQIGLSPLATKCSTLRNQAVANDKQLNKQIYWRIAETDFLSTLVGPEVELHSRELQGFPYRSWEKIMKTICLGLIVLLSC